MPRSGRRRSPASERASSCPPLDRLSLRCLPARPYAPGNPKREAAGMRAGNDLVSDDVVLGVGRTRGEAPGVELRQVEGRLEPQRELGKVLPDHGALLKAVSGKTGRIDQPGRGL